MKLHKALLKTLASGLTLAVISAASAGYSSLPENFKAGGGALIKDTVYVGLGSMSNKFYALDLSKEGAAWQAIASFPGGDRDQPVVSAVNGKLYVFGGLQKNEKGELQLVNDAYEYDPAKDAWTKLPTRSPLGLVGATGVTHGDSVYVIGGSNLSIFNGYFQDYTAAESQEAKNVVAAKYFDQRPQDYFFNTTLFRYQPSTNKWFNEGALPFSGRAGAAVAVKGNTITVVNGEVKPGLRTEKTHQGEFKADHTVKWKNLPDLPKPANFPVQDGVAGAYIGYSNGYLLVTGGANFPGAKKQISSGQLFAHKGLSKVFQPDIYALVDKKWKLVGQLPEGKGYGYSVSYGNKVLLIGGQDSKGAPTNNVITLSFDGKKVKVE